MILYHMTFGVTMRINARLDPTRSHRVQEVRNVTHEKITEIIKHSIDLYYQKVLVERNMSCQKLLKSRFIGCAEGDIALSENYKSILNLDLMHKYDHR